MADPFNDFISYVASSAFPLDMQNCLIQNIH